MTLEIGLVQRLVLFLGHQSYSITVVLATLLVAAGLGSGFAGRLKVDPSVLVRRFGEPVRYTPLSGIPREINAIFQEPARPSDGASRSMNGTAPMITVTATDVPEPRKDDQVHVRGKDYVVLHRTDDEGELVVLHLQEIR